MICGNCGLECPEGFKFCPRCGTVLEKPIQKVDRSKIRGPRETIIKAIKARDSTDEIVTPSWIWVMLIVYLAGLIASVSIGFSIAFDVLQLDPTTFSMELAFEEMKKEMWVYALIIGVFYALASVLAYLLVSRLNRHFQRDQEVRKAALALISAAASSPELNKKVEGELAAMNETDDLINTTERRRNPMVWALAIVLPLIISALQWVNLYSSGSYHEYQRTSLLFGIVGLIAYVPLFDLSYFLGKSIFDHHSRWMNFANQTTAAMNKLGLKPTESSWAGPMLRRPYALYALVTIVSLGFFMFYWWYTLIQDPNYHFKAQWDYEDSLVESISG